MADQLTSRKASGGFTRARDAQLHVLIGAHDAATKDQGGATGDVVDGWLVEPHSHAHGPIERCIGFAMTGAPTGGFRRPGTS